MTTARKQALREILRGLRDWLLDPAGRVLEDALEEDGFVQLSRDLRKATSALQKLHDRQLAGYRLGDEREMERNYDKSRRGVTKLYRLLQQAADAVEALDQEVHWWSDTEGSASRGRSVLALPVAILRRNPGGLIGRRLESPTLLVRLLGPANSRSCGRQFLVSPKDVALRPQHLIAPGTAGWLRR